MNAPHFHNQAKSAVMTSPASAFLQNLSVEITPKQIEKLPLLRERLPKGTAVFIALIDPADVARQSLKAVEEGVEDIYVGEMAQGMLQGMRADEKAMEKQLAGMLPM